MGVMLDSGRFLGAIAFAAPWISPNMFGRPIFEVKSSISSFKRNPSPSAVAPEPKAVVQGIRNRHCIACRVEYGVVSGLLGFSVWNIARRPGQATGRGGRVMLMLLRQAAAYALSMSCAVGMD